MRIVIADDEVLLRDGLASLLATTDAEVVDTVSSAEDLLQSVAVHQPDVALVDIQMPPTHTDEGIVAALDIRERFPTVAVLVLSHHLDSRFALRLLEQRPGAIGYLLKDRVP